MTPGNQRATFRRSIIFGQPMVEITKYIWLGWSWYVTSRKQKTDTTRKL